MGARWATFGSQNLAIHFGTLYLKQEKGTMRETEVYIGISGWLWDGYWHEVDNGKPFMDHIRWHTGRGFENPAAGRIKPSSTQFNKRRLNVHLA